ncbi:sulfotransferase [Limibacillus sp. MBR-115]|uniref:sulfotransferase family protein n=1 Tax=Limibacillus sp. MBR-115 TaxID=3156465 RepID=UPI003394E3BB
MDTFFVLLGAQKAGTSWLGRVLSAHPDVFMPATQEIHYFDTKHGFYDKNETLYRRLGYVEQRLAKAEAASPENVASIVELRDQIEMLIDADSDDAYRAFFERFGNGYKVCGEKTPNYSVLPQTAFDEMARVYPDTRMMFILRNPVDRFWSQFRFHADRAEKSGRRLSRFTDPFAALRRGSFAVKSDYPAVLRKMLLATGRDRCFIEYYERITNLPDAVRALFEFLNLRPIPTQELETWQARKVNTSPAMEMPEKLRRAAVQELRPVYDYVFSHMAGEPPAQWLQDYNTALPD